MQYACEVLPAAVHYLLKEIPKHFSNSNKSREGYNNLSMDQADKDLFEEMEGFDLECEEGEIVLSPFLKYCATRWLVRGEVMSRIRDNWAKLLIYFKNFQRFSQ